MTSWIIPYNVTNYTVYNGKCQVKSPIISTFSREKSMDANKKPAKLTGLHTINEPELRLLGNEITTDRPATISIQTQSLQINNPVT